MFLHIKKIKIDLHCSPRQEEPLASRQFFTLLLKMPVQGLCLTAQIAPSSLHHSEQSLLGKDQKGIGQKRPSTADNTFKEELDFERSVKYNIQAY